MDNSNNIFTFIHPTKCGGTAIEIYINSYYKNNFINNGHTNVCTKENNPIIVIREPYDRFISIFNYWKNGAKSGLFVRSEEFKKKYGNYTIKDFIKLLQENKKEDLHVNFTWHQHYSKQVSWMKEDVYKNTIVIRYRPNLDEKFQKLIKYLDLPIIDKHLEKINITKKEIVIMDEEDRANVWKLYEEDFELWNKLHNNKDLFKKVF